ncbi:beta-galactosidase [Paenibacillus aurantiacus]|uniref:Beta-galactosidase n=1 Tax=Paenibacillus aurantiacus TaxID=1936118 RepID=A0ABV5KS20_9BACL
MEYKLNAQVSTKRIYRSSLKLGGVNPDGVTIGFTNYYMEINGSPFFAICGEFHYSRYPESDWESEIAKMKLSGINVIATYIFWNHHEEIESVFEWKGNRNLRRFIELCSKQGLYIILRVGPFCHGEVRNGGLPDWLFGRTFDVRSNDEGYLNYVRLFFDQIGKQAEGLMFRDCGPVIGIQLENELNAAAALWEMTAKQGDEYLNGGVSGHEGIEHMRHLKQFVVSAGMDAPIYTSTGWGAAPWLEDEVLPLYGGYAYTPWSISDKNPHQKPTGEYTFVSYHEDESQTVDFKPPYSKSRYPYACCEMGGGMQTWYLSRFQVDPESVVAMTLVKIAGGCNFIGYYMFHGGTNPFGKTGYLNESTTPRITYDFQAPIGEFGQIRRSSHLLRPLLYFLKHFGERLAPLGTLLPEEAASIRPEDSSSLRYAVRTDGHTGYLFINNYQDHVEMEAHDNVRFTIELAEGRSLTFPQRSVLRVPRHASMMLPFNFDMDGLQLNYATAQPVTYLESDEAVTYFFAMTKDSDGELSVSGELLHLTAEWCVVERQQDDQHTVVVPWDKSSMIKIAREGMREVRIYVMTAEEASTLWEVEIAGTRRVIFSEYPIVVQGDNLELIVNGQENVTYSEFVEESGATLNHSIELASLPIPFELKTISEHKIVLKLDVEEVLQGNDDVLLKIEYTGNVGYAFSGGQLIHDHFHNGAPWEIGLSRFRDQVRNGEIVLETTPLRQGTLVFDANATMAVEQHFIGQKQAVFHRVTASPVRRVSLVVDGLQTSI